MDSGSTQRGDADGESLYTRRLYQFLARRACSTIIFGALFYALSVKLFHSFRADLFSEYFRWIIADVIVLLSAEVVLASVCYLRPSKVLVRAAILTAAIIFTWSVCNAGWLIATGTQILPSVLASLVFDPLNRFAIIGHRLALQPLMGLVLLGPSAIALVFLWQIRSCRNETTRLSGIGLSLMSCW
jgi:hypothetical protein